MGARATSVDSTQVSTAQPRVQTADARTFRTCAPTQSACERATKASLCRASYSITTFLRRAARIAATSPSPPLLLLLEPACASPKLGCVPPASAGRQGRCGETRATRPRRWGAHQPCAAAVGFRLLIPSFLPPNIARFSATVFCTCQHACEGESCTGSRCTHACRACTVACPMPHRIRHRGCATGAHSARIPMARRIRIRLVCGCSAPRLPHARPRFSACRRLVCRCL